MKKSVSSHENQLVTEINNYLASGGLFNPELADHNAVRDLLIRARDQLQVPQYVWVTGGKTWQQTCATIEDAHALIAGLGMNTPSLYPNITRVQVWRRNE